MLTKAPKLVLSKRDYGMLSALVESQHPDVVAGLEEEIGRATVVPETEVPRDVVAMDSLVKVLDLDSRGEIEYRLVFPHGANIREGRISILAPLGVALIGLRVGDEYEYLVPSGRLRRFRVLSITPSLTRKFRKGA